MVASLQLFSNLENDAHEKVYQQREKAQSLKEEVTLLFGRNASENNFYRKADDLYDLRVNRR